ncbi:MAG: FAD:protein FMN transferase [Phycisphaeraceae bacterium]|nr:FAD:protein FMN transferase [Phycisphaeraceae bacterium]
MLVACLLLPAACRAEPAGRHTFTEPAMGVAARITVVAPSADAARPAVRAAFDRIAAIESALSDWQADSEAMRLCARGRGSWPAGDDLRQVLARSIEIHAATDGAFDPTLGPLTALWRAARRDGRVPPEGARRDARARSGLDAVHLDPDRGHVTLAKAGMRFDFGGIGKGYAADEALAVLAQYGFDAALVELGGDLAIGGAPPGCAGWTVQVDPGLSDEAPFTLVLEHAGVATSGDREQHVVDSEGLVHSHILDPRTGEPVTHRIAVAVIAPDATMADALASALSVLGPRDAARILARLPGTSTIFEIATEQGVLRGWSGGSALPPPP